MCGRGWRLWQSSEMPLRRHARATRSGCRCRARYGSGKACCGTASMALLQGLQPCTATSRCWARSLPLLPASYPPRCQSLTLLQALPTERGSSEAGTVLHPDDWLVQVGWLSWAWRWFPAEQRLVCGYNSMERRPLRQACCMVTRQLLETRFKKGGTPNGWQLSQPLSPASVLSLAAVCVTVTAVCAAGGDFQGAAAGIEEGGRACAGGAGAAGGRKDGPHPVCMCVAAAVGCTAGWGLGQQGQAGEVGAGAAGGREHGHAWEG